MKKDGKMAVLEDHGFTGAHQRCMVPTFNARYCLTMYITIWYTGTWAVDAEHMDDAHCCYMEAL